MAVPRAVSTEELAADAWRAILDYFISNRDRHIALAADVGLTVGSMRTLLSLDPEEPKAMRALAEDWKCDASNVTWLVDRLEERQLVERRTSSTDRRVKTVVLTPAGVALKTDLLRRMYEPPDGLRALPRADLEALVRALGKL
ncbi:MAG TPA: MarR family transcriptional regulator [Acidimicrobiales bacterium]|nr:MarR family transcriptional regulator [Acidimicrobiales bacterium]